MSFSLKRFYIILIALSLLACLYSFAIPGIVAPPFPTSQVSEALKGEGSDRLLKVIEKGLDQDSSDRKLSKLYTYTYRDGSKILAIMVRVRKRDDFKIETYGQLTKNIKDIYISDPTSTNTVPYSVEGLLESRSSIQTCIVPGTAKLEQADVRLDGLLSSVDTVAPKQKSYLAKVLGTEPKEDFACLVLTYQPSSLVKQGNIKRSWSSIIGRVQSALAK